jgi:hypothetical protein
MRIGSLFSGIGGLELGLEWAGLGPVAWQVEIDERCRRVLARHWPEARRFADVRAVGSDVLAPVDVICGGFPCQDISAANAAGRGLDGERSGLWFEYLRVIAELRPRVVVVENVARLVRRGLDVVVGGLVDLGFEVEGTRLRASDVGAPHRRERLFLVAYRDGIRRAVGGHVACTHDGAGAGQSVIGGSGVAYADGAGEPQQGGAFGCLRGWVGDGGNVGVGDAGVGASQPGVGGNADGLPDGLDGARWPAGRGPYQHPWEPARTVAARTMPDRGARVKALGNAVVPWCAYVVGMRVRQRMGGV